MTEIRDLTIDHTAGEVSITLKAGGRATLDPGAARAVSHILAAHADAADRRRKRNESDELRAEFRARNDLASRPGDDLARLAVDATVEARTAEPARIREWEGHRSGSSAPEEIA